IGLLLRELEERRNVVITAPERIEGIHLGFEARFFLGELLRLAVITPEPFLGRKMGQVLDAPTFRGKVKATTSGTRDVPSCDRSSGGSHAAVKAWMSKVRTWAESSLETVRSPDFFPGFKDLFVGRVIPGIARGLVQGLSILR